MRSQEWKSMTLRSPELRRFRTSLRLILRSAINTELEHLRDLKDIYRKKRLDNKIVSSQQKR